MKPTPDYRRLLATIRHDEPDRVPLAELGIDAAIKEASLGRPVCDVRDEVEFWWRAGYDYLYLRPSYEYLGAPGSAAVGTPFHDRSDPEPFTMTRAGPVGAWADLDRYPWPDSAAVDCGRILDAASLLPEGMGIISGVGGIFTRTWMIMGFEHFCLSLESDPGLVAAVFARVGQIQTEILRRIVAFPKVFAIWYGDDLAFGTSLLVSPHIYRRHLYPWIEEMASIAHRAYMPFILHSDGKLWALLNDLIALGVDALHPIEPKAMDILEVKRRYGGRLALFGNIDLGSTLVYGSPDDVRAEVRERIRSLAPGGGYAVGSSNTVTAYVPLENFNAMRQATLEYGQYPIRC